MGISVSREFALCLVGVWCLSLSISIMLSLMHSWIFSNLPIGGFTSIDSTNAALLFSLASVITGIIGGYLIGRYLRIKSTIKNA